MSDWGDVVSRHSARLYEESLHAFQRQAAEARSQLNAGIQVLTDGFVLYDRHDRLVLCNARFRDFYPKSARALQVGARFEDIVRYGMTQGEYAIEPGREEAWIQERLARHRAADSVIEEQLADGRWLRIVERATPDGGRVGLRIDITEQKRARARLAAIIRGTDAGTWEYNVQTGETIFNDRYMEMLGHSRATFGPSHIDTFRNFVHAEDIARITADLDRHLAGDTPLYQAEFRMRHKEGHHVWVLSRGRVGSWSSGRRALWVYGTHQEITARKEAEASLHAARRAAEQASEAKSAFLAQMSHEIRTPMNGVLAMVEVLADEIENPHHRDLLTTIRDSGEALMRILNDLLDYSKIEACRLEIERIPFVPSDLAARIAALHRHAAEERGLELCVGTAGAVDAPRLGDSHRLLQILHNLVSNAIKFTPQGSVEVRVEVSEVEGLILFVRDEGIGMTEAQAAIVFDSFSQADVSTTRRFGGTGLGMAIVRRLVDLMQGSIEMKTAQGEGTAIRIALPLPLTEEEQETQPEAPGTAALPPGLHILVADDGRTNRLVLSKLLEQMGTAVTLACDGPEAVQKARAVRFDAILMDISMPDMDGMMALARIRADEGAAGQPPVPALAVTANALPHQVEGYLTAGFAGHVAKPINRSRLQAALRACLDQPETQRGAA